MSQGTDGEGDRDAMSNPLCIGLHVSLYGSSAMMLVMFIRTSLCL